MRILKKFEKSFIWRTWKFSKLNAHWYRQLDYSRLLPLKFEILSSIIFDVLLRLPGLSLYPIVISRSEVGRGTGAVASHGEGNVRWGTHDLIPCTRVMIINPQETAPFSPTTPTVNAGAPLLFHHLVQSRSDLPLPPPPACRPAALFFPLTN